MATFFGSSTFLSHPITRTHHLSSSSQPPPSQPPLPPPPQLPNSQPQSPPQQLMKSSPETLSQPLAASLKVPQGKSGSKSASTNTTADSTDWIASSLTRRFGLGAGLAWAGFLAFGVVSEQIKTRLEVSQQEANTRYPSK